MFPQCATPTSFPQGATPTFILTLPSGWDLTLASKVVASFRCLGVQYDIDTQDLEISENTATVRLTQEQTLTLQQGATLKIQLNWLYPNGIRAASKVWRGQIDEQLLMEVMS